MNSATPSSLSAALSKPWAFLALAALLYAPWIDTRVGQGNVASDLAAIESLAERGTFYIDGSSFETIDKFKRGEDFFSQKSPVFHLAAAAPYLVLRAAGYSLAANTAFCLWVLTFLLAVLPMGWLLWLIFDHPWARGRSLRFRWLLALGFALGSLLTPFAVTLNHYVPAAAFLMAAVRIVLSEPVRGRFRQGALAGAYLSASFACDTSAAFLFGAGLGLYWLLADRRRFLGLAAGAAPLLLLYAALNVWILGSPLPPNFHEKEMLLFEGSYWKAFHEKAARGEPNYYHASYARRLYHAALGHKGIYWMMPLLLAASAAAVTLASRRAEGWRAALAFAAFPLAAIALTMRWAIDLSGGAYGVRHVYAAVAPLYCVLAHPALDWNSRAARGAAFAAGAWGILIAGIGVAGGPWSANTLSAYPPLENLARLSLRNANLAPTAWIPRVIESTALDPANAWLDLALAHEAAERFGEAERAYRRSIAADPAAPLAYFHLGFLLGRSRRDAEAAQAFETVVRLEPKNLGAWQNLGRAAFRNNDLPRARSAYSQSLALAPGNLTGVLGVLIVDLTDGRADPKSPEVTRLLRAHASDSRAQAIALHWGISLQADENK